MTCTEETAAALHERDGQHRHEIELVKQRVARAEQRLDELERILRQCKCRLDADKPPP